jgi:hypothetical protein
MLRSRFAQYLALVGLIAPGLTWGQVDPITVSYEPVWTGTKSSEGWVPFRIRVENRGNPEVVEIASQNGDSETSTFFEMPKGATKERIIYLRSPEYGFGAELTVRRGFIQSQLRVETEFGNQVMDQAKFALISDSIGDTSLLRFDTPEKQKNKAWQQGFLMVGAKPGRLPDRSVGYDLTRSIVLGEGSERLTDSEIDAVKAAVLMGKTLIFVGGAISPTINDPRWRDILPVRPGSAVGNLNPGKEFAVIHNVLPPAVPVLNLEPHPMSKVRIRSGGVPIVVSRPFGAGSVKFLAFDPFHPEMRRWPGRYSFFYQLGEPERMELEGMIRSYSQDSYDFNYGVSYEPESSGGVFDLEMPSAGRVAMVLIGYLILVVPINFLVLRKLGKGELAWLTGPVIALGAGGILFAFAGGLYSAESARHLSGVLVGSTASPDLRFVGRQQMFFANAGRYDLGLKGVESVWSSNNTDMAVLGKPMVRNRFIDAGEIVGAGSEVTSMSFREFNLSQRVPVSAPLAEARLVVEGGKRFIKGTVVNRLASKVEQFSVVVGSARQVIGDFEPGKSGEFKLDVTKSYQPGVPVQLEGKILGSELGAQVGKTGQGAGVQLYYFVQEVGE